MSHPVMYVAKIISTAEMAPAKDDLPAPAEDGKNVAMTA